jgi:uncharacterized membrane protein YdbT with pleckstrin-like domain
VTQSKQEQIIIDTRPYVPLFFFSIRPIMGAIVTIVFCILALVTNMQISQVPIFLILAAFGLLYVIGWLFCRWIRWLTIRLTITNRVVIYRWYNWQLTKKQREFPIDRITSVDTSQNLFERILGAGDLVLKTPTGEEALPDIPRVDRVRNAIVGLIGSDD